MAAGEQYEPYVVSAFGGGLAFAAHPFTLRDDKWTWSQGYLARNGYAESALGYSTPAAALPAAGVEILGITQNPFDANNAVLVLTRTLATSVIRLWTLNDAATYTEIPWDGIGPVPLARSNGTLSAAFINGFVVLTAGAFIGGSNPGIIRWSPDVSGGVFSAVGGEKFGAEHLAAFAGHLIAAGTFPDQAGARTLWISDANSERFPTPNIGNSSDTVVLADSDSGITGLLPIGNNSCLVFTRSGQYALTPTGGIPPFTLSLTGPRPCLDQSSSSIPTRHTFLGSTPYGPVYRGLDDLYLNDTPIAREIFDYYRQVDSSWVPRMLWHPGLNVLAVPSPRPVDGFNGGEWLYYDPVGQAWSRALTFNDQSLDRHAIIMDNRHGTQPFAAARHWIAGRSGLVLASTTTSFSNSFVDTKDFVFNNPLSDTYVDRIKVDWEPLENATTDSLDVLMAGRNEFARGTLGSAGEEMDLSSQFVLQGTLVGGASELDLRGRFKIRRFRFRQNIGRNRIRGFTLSAQEAGARRAA